MEHLKPVKMITEAAGVEWGGYKPAVDATPWQPLQLQFSLIMENTDAVTSLFQMEVETEHEMELCFLVSANSTHLA